MSERDYDDSGSQSHYDEDVSIRTESDSEENDDDEDDIGYVPVTSGDGFKNRRGYQKAKKEDYITSSFLTKYEKARILGTRAL